MTLEQTAQSICDTAADYRSGELAAPDVDHVLRWLGQFDPGARLPLLGELDHVLKRTYVSQEDVTVFLRNLIRNPALAGDDRCAFWKNANFLDIQTDGRSQHEMLSIFDRLLGEECGLTIGDCGGPGPDHIYLDDIIFSGSRVQNDLAPWIRDHAPRSARVHVIVMALHTSSEWVFRTPLADAISASGKAIEFKQWRGLEFENQKQNRYSSAVLWPSSLPAGAALQAYVAAQKYPPELRQAGGTANPDIFSSEAGRSLLEQEMLKAGMKIRSFSQNPAESVRPLGFSRFGLGFGSTFVTYRNCPNNSPLALWWGDPQAHPSHPFSKWYPLFPRKTYQS